MQTTHRGVVALLLVLISTSIFAESNPANFASGQYEQLQLAVDTDGWLTGYYQEEQGTGTSKTCSFYLSGRMNGKSAIVRTWSDHQTPGRLSAIPGGVRLQIDGGREHAGCGLVLPAGIESGLEFDRVVDAAWLELRTITAPRVHFHYSPDERQVMRSFVIAGDAVAVVDRQRNWLLVEYRGKKRITKGWILKEFTGDLKFTAESDR